MAKEIEDGAGWEHLLPSPEERDANPALATAAVIKELGTPGSISASLVGATGQTEREPGVFAIQKLAQHNVELALQLGILVNWAEGFSVKYCRCENNGDYCEFHSMLADAKEALK